MNVEWKSEPDDHDYPAATEYLTLGTSLEIASEVVDQLRNQPIKFYKAKDLLRASALNLLDKDNKHVAKDLEKIEAGEKLSPVLVIRGDIQKGRPALIADGYHRICASYWVDENVKIPVQIISVH